jgi:hypothetical protein
MAIIHVGNARFIDGDPAGTGQPPLDIYPYADFRSLEHVSFGLVLTTGGPEGDEIDSVQVGQYGMDPLAPYWEFAVALDEIEGANRAKRSSERYKFEEVPYVEVETAEDYDEALKALGVEDDEEGDWRGPGLYDFRDDPPTFQGSVEKHELEEMTMAADDAIEFMFQGEEWQEAYEKLAQED